MPQTRDKLLALLARADQQIAEAKSLAVGANGVTVRDQAAKQLAELRRARDRIEQLLGK